VIFEDMESADLVRRMQEKETELNKWWRNRLGESSHNAKIKEAPLPSNIKWEHRNRTGWKKRRKIIFTYLITISIMAATTFLIFYFRLQL
jgi:hypothetical protein